MCCYLTTEYSIWNLATEDTYLNGEFAGVFVEYFRNVEWMCVAFLDDFKVRRTHDLSSFTEPEIVNRTIRGCPTMVQNNVRKSWFPLFCVWLISLILSWTFPVSCEKFPDFSLTEECSPISKLSSFFFSQCGNHGSSVGCCVYGLNVTCAFYWLKITMILYDTVFSYVWKIWSHMYFCT